MVAVDEVIYDLITDKLAEIRSDPTVLNDIFSGRSTERIETAKQFCLNNDIKVVKHYPRMGSEWPCYAIILEGSTEADQVIGTSGDSYTEYPVSYMNDGWIGSDSLLITDVTEYISGTATGGSSLTLIDTAKNFDSDEHPEWRVVIGSQIEDVTKGVTAVVSSISTTTNTNDTINFVGALPENANFGDLDKYKAIIRYGSVEVPPSDVAQSYYYDTLEQRRVCRMLAKKDTSTGKGIFLNFEHSVLNGGFVSLTQMNNIVIRMKSNRVGSFLKFAFGESAHGEHEYPITITERNVWERVILDISAVTDEEKDTVKYMSFVITNDDADIDVMIDEVCAETSVGYIHDEFYLDHRYRIESWSNNADLTLDMHTMLLWWMLKYRTWMQNSHGVIKQRVDGADIMFQPDFYPEFAYVRGLVFSSQTIEPIPREIETSRKVIRVNKIDYY